MYAFLGRLNCVHKFPASFLSRSYDSTDSASNGRGINMPGRNIVGTSVRHEFSETGEQCTYLRRCRGSFGNEVPATSSLNLSSNRFLSVAYSILPRPIFNSNERDRSHGGDRRSLSGERRISFTFPVQRSVFVMFVA